MARRIRGTGEAWLRGGQTFNHTLDMILEVIGRLAIPAVIWGAICLWLGNAKSSELQQTYGLQYALARCFNWWGWPWPQKMTLKGLDGFERVYTNDQVLHLRWMTPYADVYFHNLRLAGWIWIAGVVIILCIATNWFIQSGEDKLKSRFIRGQRAVPLSALVAEVEAFNKAETKRRKDRSFRAVKLIGVAYPYATEREHTLTVGSPGSGKSQAIHKLLESIRARGDRAIIYDPELEYTTYHFNPDTDLILNPYDARSVGWSPYNDAHELPEFEKLAVCIFKEPKSGDPYWTRATRQVFVYAAYQLKRQYPDATLEDLLKVFFGPMNVLVKLVENTPAATHLAGGSNGRTDSLRSVLSEGINSLVHLAGSRADFSLRAWVNRPERSPGFLFMSAPETHMESLRPLLSFWSELVVSALLGRVDEHSRHTTWIILDEFPSLGKVTSLASGPERLRKYGGCVVLGMQQVSQIQEIYGHEIAQTIIGQCATKLILRCQDPETAKHMAEQLGRRQTRRVDETVSYGANTLRDGVGLTPREELELVALPDEVMNLPKFHGFIRLSNAREGEPFPISTLRFGYTARRKRAEGLILPVGVGPVDAFFQSLKQPAAPAASAAAASPAQAPAMAAAGRAADGSLFDADGVVVEGEGAAAEGARAVRPDPPATGEARGEGAAAGGPEHSAWRSSEDAMQAEAKRLAEAGPKPASAYAQLHDKVRRDDQADVPLVGVASWRKRPGEEGRESPDKDAPPDAGMPAPSLDVFRQS